MSELVTIGIPCFNAAQWLRTTIESALNQTWPNCEIIVVDDGSSDTSLVVASAFGDRVQALSGGRRGSNYARNMILREARGEWVQFLDADDYLEPGKIAQQLAETSGGAEADVIYSPVWIETTTDGAVVREVSPLDTSLDLYSQWLSWQLPQTGGCLWRRSALEEIGGWRNDQPCCQEHELYFRALRSGLRWRYAPTPGAVYRIWSEGTLCRKDPQLVIRVKTHLVDQMRTWLEQSKRWTKTHERVAGRACLEMARTLATHDLGAAVKYHRDRRNRGLLHLDGPAAPRSYRASYRLLGFELSERLAKLRR